MLKNLRVITNWGRAGFIRTHENDIMRKTSISEGSLCQKEIPWQKRAGRPRMKWVDESSKRVYTKLFHGEIDFSNQVHIDSVLHKARNRKF